MELKLLGGAGLEVRSGGELRRISGKPSAVLTLLSVERREWDRAEMAALLWSTSSQERARASVRQAVYTLRAALGDGLETAGSAVSLSPRVATDLDRLREAIDSVSAEALLALDTWELGPKGVSDPAWLRWLDAAQITLERDLTQALRRAAAASSSDQPRVAIACLKRASRSTPEAVAPRLDLIRLHLSRGEHVAAREAAAEARDVLADDPNAMHAISGLIEEATEAVDVESPRTQDASAEWLPLIDRGDVLARLNLEVEAGASAVLVSGPAGCGRSRLLRELYDVQRSLGRHAVIIRTPRTQETMPLALLSDLVRYLRRIPGSLGGSSESDRILDSLLPESGQPGPGASDLRRIADATVDVLQAVAEETPAVLIMDDIQWIDAQSLDVLARVAAKRIRGISLVAACRSGTRLTGPEALHEVFPVRVPVGPVGGAQLLAFLASMTADPAPAGPLVRRLLSWTGGNAEALAVAFQTLKANQVLGTTGPTWVFGHVEPACPSPVADLWARRASELSPDAARSALRTVSSPSGTLRRAISGPVHASEPLADELAGLDVARPEKTGQLVATCPAATRALRTGMTHRSLRATGLLAAGVAFLTLAVGTFSPRNDGARLSSGQLVTFTGRTALQLATSLLPTQSRSFEPFSTMPDSFVAHGAMRSPTGEMMYYGRVARGIEIPPAAAVVGMDGAYLLRRTDPIQSGAMAMSPLGDFALLRVQTSGPSEEWRENLVATPLEAGLEEVTLLAPRALIPMTSWSPDGLTIAATISATVDTVVFLTAEGRVVASAADARYPNLAGRLDWCPDSEHVVASAHGMSTGEERIVRISARDGSFEPIPSGLELQIEPLCVADAGSQILVRAVERPDPAYHAFLIHQTDGGPRIERVIDSVTTPIAAWLPDVPVPVVVDLEFAADTVVLAWGDRRELPVSAVYSNGDRMAVDVEWASLRTSVAQAADGTITGAGPGVATVTGRFGHLVDTVVVHVVGSAPDEALVEESFDTGWEQRWLLDRARPLPTAARLEPEETPALSLNGDGVFGDAIALRTPIDMRLGATAELDFRVELNARTHQRVGFCLQGGEGDAGQVLDSRGEAEVCFFYPVGDLEKQRTDLALLTLSPPAIRVAAPMVDDGEWHHVALQIDATGRAALFVDRERVADSEWRLPLEDDLNWYLSLSGASKGGRTEVRNVLVRRGVQYPQ